MQDDPATEGIRAISLRSTVGADGSVTQTVELIGPGTSLVRRAYLPATGPHYFRTERTSAEGLTIDEVTLHSGGDLNAASTIISAGDEVTLRTHTVEEGHARGAVEFRRPAASAAQRVVIHYYPE